MKYKLIYLKLISALFFIILLLTSACGRERKTEEGEIIAVINEEKISNHSILEFIGSESLSGMTESEKRDKMEEIIKLTVLAQEAERRGLTDHPEISERIRLASNRIKANLLLSEISNNIVLTEAEIFNYYQIHKSRYVTQREEYLIQRILLPSEAMADSVATLIVNNEHTFSEAARIFSRERARERDGFLGYLTPDEMESAIWNGIRNIAQWRFTRVQASNGIFLVRYTERRNRVVESPFTEVAERVREELLEERRKDMINKLLDELIGKAEIIISN